MTQDDARPMPPGAADEGPSGGGPAPDPRRDGLEQVFELDHPRGRVWAALTEGDLLGRWLLPCSLDALGGGRLEGGTSFSFVMPADEGGEGRIDCEVVDVEPGRRLGYTWRTHGEEDTRPAEAVDALVSFELEAIAPGRTRLRIRQVAIPTRSRGGTVVSLAARRREPRPPVTRPGPRPLDAFRLAA